MPQNAILKVRERIEKINVRDCDWFLYKIQLASRLKALGDGSVFDSMLEELKTGPYSGQFEELLAERCRQGIWDIGEQLDEELGLAIVEAQDFYTFLLFTEDLGLYSSQTAGLLREWSESAGSAELGEETAAFLRNWKETYPIDEEYCLSSVAMPLEEEYWEMLQNLADQLPETEISCEWKQEGDSDVCRLAAGSEEVSVKRTEYPDALQFEVSPADGILTQVRTIRQGKISAYPMGGKGIWKILRNRLPSDMKEFLNEAVSIRLAGKVNWSVTPALALRKPLSGTPAREYIYRLRQDVFALCPTMAAETQEDESFQTFTWQGTAAEPYVTGIINQVELRFYLPKEGKWSTAEKLQFLGLEVQGSDKGLWTVPYSAVREAAEKDMENDWGIKLIAGSESVVLPLKMEGNSNQ